MKHDIVIVGGAGHVGLPLGIAFANAGQSVLIYDINLAALDRIKSGSMPFMEAGAEPLLKKALAKGLISFSDKAESVSECKVIVVTIGTPVDEFFNPSLDLITDCFTTLAPHLRNEHHIVLRSTVYPGVSEWVAKFLGKLNLKCELSFCPERIVQGFAIEELKSLPQIVSGLTQEAEETAVNLFRLIAPEVIRVSLKEAEFAKLFCNAFRYIQFAAANQFYMICESANVEYNNVLKAMKHNYPRMKDVPGAGFAAGPCLFKDTMQLSSFYENQFSIGLQSMLVNEGMPLYLVGRLKEKHDLTKKTIGLLGMAFKAESDDRRSSLSYKLKKALVTQARQVLTTDPFVSDDPDLVPAEEVVEKSDILILCAPHQAYKKLDLRGRETVDIWSFLKPPAPIRN